MGIKSFWKKNRNGYIYSCIAITLLGFFIGAIKKLDMTATSIFILCSFPIMFLMAFGLYEFTRGEK